MGRDCGVVLTRLLKTQGILQDVVGFSFYMYIGLLAKGLCFTDRDTFPMSSFCLYIPRVIMFRFNSKLILLAVYKYFL